MKKQIACCGFDCATCEVRIATVNDDNALRASLADEWKVLYNSDDITPEMINCAGCRGTGALNMRCKFCEIRKCAMFRSFPTCAECDELEDCLLLKKVHHHVPEALENLKQLKNK